MYIEHVHQMIIESPSPNKIFRLASKLNLVNDTELNNLLDSVTDRNLTSHTYNETIAEKIYDHIPLYHATMKAVVDRLKFD